MTQRESVSREELETNFELPRLSHRPGFSKKLCCCIAGMALGFLAGSSLQAEEQPFSFQLQGLFDEHRLLSSRPASYILNLAAEPSAASQSPFHLIETCHLTSLFKKVEGEDDLERDSSITLFRKPMPSRYAYHSWAGLRTGWGQYFAADTFGRSRTNGAGLNEPDFIYVKMSVRF